jgi:hypothetical protein
MEKIPKDEVAESESQPVGVDSINFRLTKRSNL